MRLTIGTRIMGGFLLVGLLMGTVLGFSVTSTTRQKANTSLLVQDVLAAKARSLELLALIDEQSAAVFAYILHDDTTLKTEYEQARSEADKLIGDLRAAATSDEFQKLMAALETARDRFNAIADSIVSQRTQGNSQTHVLRQQRNEFDAAAHAIADLVTETARQIEERNTDAATRDLAIQSGLTLVAILGGVIIALLLSRSVARAMAQTVRAAESLAQGGLTTRLTLKRNDEIGEMAKAFNQMVENLRGLMTSLVASSEATAATAGELNQITSEVTRHAEQINGASGQVAQAAATESERVNSTARIVDELRTAIDQIAAGAQEQARSAEETANLISRMLTDIEQAATLSARVASSSQAAREMAEKGGGVVTRASEGMKRIHIQVQASAQQVHELGERSTQIGQITQAITDIADQTNLLALNAAIEAARAGEHGRGFAVVAEEVRRLAEKASRSAQEIAALIAGIQSDAIRAVAGMTEVTAEVEQGTNMASNASEALENIRRLVEQNDRDVAAISNATATIAESCQEVMNAMNTMAAITEESTAGTEQMAAGSEQVTTLIQDMATAAEENAASAEEVSTSVESLTANTSTISAHSSDLEQVALRLQEQIGRFRL